MDRGAWWATVHGAAKSRTEWLSTEQHRVPEGKMGGTSWFYSPVLRIRGAVIILDTGPTLNKCKCGHCHCCPVEEVREGLV